MNSNISTDITVKELLDRYPRLLQMFMDMELMCVGCPTETFHTLWDVAREYRLDLNQFLQRIHKAIGDDKESQGPSPQKVKGGAKRKRDMIY